MIAKQYKIIHYMKITDLNADLLKFSNHGWELKQILTLDDETMPFILYLEKESSNEIIEESLDLSPQLKSLFKEDS